MRSAHPEWTADQVRRALTETAVAGRRTSAEGIVDVAAAIEADVASLPAEEPEAEVSPVWSAAATAAGGGLIGMSALLLRGGRGTRGSGRVPGRPRTMAG